MTAERIYLASRRLPDLPDFLRARGAPPRAVFVPTAAHLLPDRDDIVDEIHYGPISKHYKPEGTVDAQGAYYNKVLSAQGHRIIFARRDMLYSSPLYLVPRPSVSPAMEFTVAADEFPQPRTAAR